MSSSNFDVEEYLDRIRAQAKRALFEVKPIGFIEGFPLLVLRRPGQTPDQEPLASPTATVYLSAGVHGDEPAGPLALLRLFQQRWFSPDIEWTVFPLLNPTGMSLGKRENSRGEDLNRDYFLKNCSEVKAHREWLDNHCQPRNYDLSLMLHEDWEATGFYIYELAHDPALRIHTSMLQAALHWVPLDLSETIDGHQAREGRIAPLEFEKFTLDNETDLPGAEAVYLSKYYTRLNYTLETPSALPIATRVDTHVAVIQAAVENFLKLPRDSGKPKNA
mgnify:CR=1 FL=1